MIRKIFLAFWCLGSLAIAGACVFCFVYSYTEALERIMVLLHITDKRTQITTQILPPARFELLRYGLLIASIGSVISVWYAFRLARQVQARSVALGDFLWGVFKSFIIRWLALTRLQKAVTITIFVVGLSPILWRIVLYGYWVDEVFSYVFLVKRGALVSLTYYPGPNNHVFFTFIAALSMPIAKIGIEPILLMRLWAFLGVFAASLILFAWLLERQNVWNACAGTAIFLLQPPVQMYGSLARGYAWQMLFFLILWIAMWEYTRQPRKVYAGIGILSSIAGFYTLPTFLYSYAPLVLISLWLSKKSKHILMQQIIAGLGVFILYLPIIALNGWQAIAGNQWLKVGQDVFWQDILNGHYFAEIIGFWGFELPIGIALGLCLVGFALLWAVERQARLWVAGVLLMPLVLLCFQRVLPPVRVWSYQSVSIAIAVSFVWQQFPTWQKIIQICLIMLLVGSISVYWQFFPAQAAHEQVAQKIWQQKPKRVFANHDTYQMFIRYVYARHDTPLQIEVICKPQNPDYEWIILDKSQRIPPCLPLPAYRKVMENEEVQVYTNQNLEKTF